MTDEQQLWDALGAVRPVLEETLLRGTVRPADEVETVEEEVEALVRASAPTGAAKSYGVTDVREFDGNKGHQPG